MTTHSILLKNLFAFVSVAVAFAGCAAFDQTMLVPEKDGIYHSIAVDSSEYAAQRSALRRAEKTCKKRDMQYIVTGHQTYFRGTPKDPNARIAPMSTGEPTMARQTIPQPGTEEDYKTVVTFVCEGLPSGDSK